MSAPRGHRIGLVLGITAAIAFIGGCASTETSSDDAASASTPASKPTDHSTTHASSSPSSSSSHVAPSTSTAYSTQTPVNDVCIVSGEPLTAGAVVIDYHGHPIGFATPVDHRQFERLPEHKQARLAGAPILRSRGVINERCPITGERLTADAQIVHLDSLAIGVTDATCVRQWASMTDSSRRRVIAADVLAAAGVANTHCPICGDMLWINSPTHRYMGMTVGFSTDADVRQFESMSDEAQARLLATVAAETLNAVNDHCPVSGEPITSYAAVRRVDGHTVALATEADAGQWDRLPESAQSRLIAVDVLEVSNSRCPVSGRPIHIDSPVIVVGARRIAFATEADARQWDSIPESQQARLLSMGR